MSWDTAFNFFAVVVAFVNKHTTLRLQFKKQFKVNAIWQRSVTDVAVYYSQTATMCLPSVHANVYQIVPDTRKKGFDPNADSAGWAGLVQWFIWQRQPHGSKEAGKGQNQWSLRNQPKKSNRGLGKNPPKPRHTKKLAKKEGNIWGFNTQVRFTKTQVKVIQVGQTITMEGEHRAKGKTRKELK